MALTPFLGMPVLLTEIEFHTVEEAGICTGELGKPNSQKWMGDYPPKMRVSFYVYIYILWYVLYNI